LPSVAFAAGLARRGVLGGVAEEILSREEAADGFWRKREGAYQKGKSKLRFDQILFEKGG